MSTLASLNQILRDHYLPAVVQQLSNRSLLADAAGRDFDVDDCVVALGLALEQRKRTVYPVKAHPPGLGPRSRLSALAE